MLGNMLTKDEVEDFMREADVVKLDLDNFLPIFVKPKSQVQVQMEKKERKKGKKGTRDLG